MYGELIGIISAINDNNLILNVGGVGYVVHMSAHLLSGLQCNKEIKLLIETRFKVDKIVLFGFLTTFQKHAFCVLSEISGISDKVSMILACNFNANDFVNFYSATSPPNIRIDGMGQKTWEKVLFSLKQDKVFYKYCLNSSSSSVLGTYNLQADAINALTGMGINQQKASEIITKIIRERGNLELEELIKIALSTYK